MSKPITELEKVTAPENTDWSSWVSATSTKNYISRDPLLDWLKYNYRQNVNSFFSGCEKYKTTISFKDYILEQGHIFEDNVVKALADRFGSEKIVSLNGEMNSRSSAKVKETVDAMKRGIPIIHGGLLHNPKTKTYGVPDLIVRSDWLNCIVNRKILKRSEERIRAPALRGDGRGSERSPCYHYVIVDVKFSTLPLRADGVHILNSGLYPAYKSQLYIYNEALSIIQGYKPVKAWILGRRSRYTKQKRLYVNNNCFDNLGQIDWSGIDKEYIEKTTKAVEWVKICRSPIAKTWNVTSFPLTRKELYPNMSNQYDDRWRGLKREIAEKNGEMTSLWMVGTKHREIAHAKGVYKWTDPSCNAKTLGFNSGYQGFVIDKILDINRSKSKKIQPSVVKYNPQNWQTTIDDVQNLKDLQELYVDFETINDALTDFQNFPYVKNTNMIFLIGVGYSYRGKFIYKEFTADRLTPSEEMRICKEFDAYVTNLGRYKKLKCVHWAPAERIMWEAACKRHFPVSKQWNINRKWDWFDLLDVFKTEPIVIRGAMGFSLKEIATAMKKQSLIKTSWNANSACLNGTDAMLGAWKAHKEAVNDDISMKQTSIIKDIIEYNVVDIKVLFEILQYLRKNHVQTKKRKRENTVESQRKKKTNMINTNNN